MATPLDYEKTISLEFAKLDEKVIKSFQVYGFTAGVMPVGEPPKFTLQGQKVMNGDGDWVVSKEWLLPTPGEMLLPLAPEPVPFPVGTHLYRHFRHSSPRCSFFEVVGVSGDERDLRCGCGVIRGFVTVASLAADSIPRPGPPDKAELWREHLLQEREIADDTMVLSLERTSKEIQKRCEVRQQPHPGNPWNYAMMGGSFNGRVPR
jgi:hypothetical protein